MDDSHFWLQKKNSFKKKHWLTPFWIGWLGRERERSHTGARGNERRQKAFCAAAAAACSRELSFRGGFLRAWRPHHVPEHLHWPRKSMPFNRAKKYVQLITRSRALQVFLHQLNWSATAILPVKLLYLASLSFRKSSFAGIDGVQGSWSSSILAAAGASASFFCQCAEYKCARTARETFTSWETFFNRRCWRTASQEAFISSSSTESLPACRSASFCAHPSCCCTSAFSFAVSLTGTFTWSGSSSGSSVPSLRRSGPPVSSVERGEDLPLFECQPSWAPTL